MASEIKILQKIIMANMGYKAGERVLVVADTGKRAIGRLFFDAARAAGADPSYVEMLPREESGVEPPSAVASAMLASDIILIVTTKSLTHTKARRDASEKGARIASMPSLERRMIASSMDTNYSRMKSLTEKLGAVLRKTRKIHIRTAAGTDLHLDVAGRFIDDDTGIMKRPGDISNLPAGESSVSPKEGTAKGIFVIDGSYPDVLVKRPIRVTVRKGFAVDIEGGPQAAKLKRQLAAVGDRNAFSIAELGIGTNKSARLTGNVLEDEKVYGTIHIAFGNNKSYNGKVDVPIHLDCVIRKPTIMCDGVAIMEKGVLRI